MHDTNVWRARQDKNTSCKISRLVWKNQSCKCAYIKLSERNKTYLMKTKPFFIKKYNTFTLK